MNQKTILITGATSGIGLATAVAVAKTGARTIIHGRSEAKCQAAVEQVQTATGNQDIEYVVCDLANVAATRAAADDFLARFDRLDVLINNAGGIFLKRRLSQDGVEMTVALNVVGPHVLTNSLLDLLKHTAAQNPAFGARIVNVSSEQHRSGVNWDDLMGDSSFDRFKTYSHAKALLNILTFEQARRLAGTGVTANALHPGVVNTDVLKKDGANLIGTVIGWIGRFFLLSPEKGAETSVYLALSPAVQGVTGKYFDDKKEKASDASTLDPADGARLWAHLEQWSEVNK